MAAVNLISSIQARSCQGTFVDPSGLQPAMGVVSQPGYPDAPLPYEEIKAGAGSQVARYLNHEGPPPRGEPPPKEKEDARQAGEVGAAAPPTDVDTTGSSLEIDAQAATTAPEDWTQNPYVQIEGGFLAGVSLGLVPMGGVGQQLADAGEVLPHGTPEARLGLSVGMIVGGIAITAGGMAGGLLGGATTATGAGAPVGVPAMVVSTTLVVGGAGNIAAGIRGLTQSMMSNGSGSSDSQPAATLKWGNPTSKPTYGHTFEKHGAGAKNSAALLGRARGPKGGPQGQWLDNKAVAKWLAEQRPGISEPKTIPLPQGMGQVIRPDGSIVPATRATLVPAPNGGYRTAFPVE